MRCVKKKETDEEPDQEEEHLTIDFDRIFLMGRIRLGFAQNEIERMTFGKYVDIHRSYRELYNFEVRNIPYMDVERDIQKYREEHQPVASLLSL